MKPVPIPGELYKLNGVYSYVSRVFVDSSGDMLVCLKDGRKKIYRKIFNKHSFFVDGYKCNEGEN